MPDRINRLVNAYFFQPLKEYTKVITEISESGGLTEDEVEAIKNQVLYVDAYTIARHAGAASLGDFAQVERLTRKAVVHHC